MSSDAGLSALSLGVSRKPKAGLTEFALTGHPPVITASDSIRQKTQKELFRRPSPPKVTPPATTPPGQIAGAAAAVRKRTLDALAARGARGGTIRTSGLGLLGEPYLANKTLLGA